MSGYIGNPRQVFVTDSLTRSQVEDAEFDFNNMPTVGGDPIVESGSNSDGEWTAFSSGFLVMGDSFQIDLTAQSINLVLGSYPMGIVGGSNSGFISCRDALQSSDREALESMTLRTRSFEFEVSFTSGNATSTSVQFRATIVARWK